MTATTYYGKDEARVLALGFKEDFVEKAAEFNPTGVMSCCIKLTRQFAVGDAA